MRPVLAFLFAVAALSCGNSTTVVESGIEGRVTKSPTCAAETVPPSPECQPAPLVATLEVRDMDGNTLARVTSERDGGYRMALNPGDYAVYALPVSPRPSFPMPPHPIEVSVTPRAWITVDVDYDTGIR